MMRNRIGIAWSLVVAGLLFHAPAQAERLKDLARIDGVRANQLIGYGLVVGLDGTGDQTSQAQFTVQSLKNLLTQLGVTVPPGVNLQPRNVAAVAVHAELPPFAKPGQDIDITVSSIANAGSLRGGSLLMTPLKGADGEIYALAQGSLVVGGFGAAGRDGSRVAINVPSSGRIPGGAIIEREVPMDLLAAQEVTLNLHSADFTTASRIVESINAVYGHDTAQALDAVSVRVRAPSQATQRVHFLAELENLRVEPGAAAARVVVNSRTGTIVIGSNVRVMPAAVSHGSLSVTISESFGVSQPPPFSGGDTVVVPQSQVEVREEGGRMFLLDPGVTLSDLVRAINEVGAAPGDLIAILEALKRVGALRAELVVI